MCVCVCVCVCVCSIIMYVTPQFYTLSDKTMHPEVKTAMHGEMNSITSYMTDCDLLFHNTCISGT